MRTTCLLAFFRNPARDSSKFPEAEPRDEIFTRSSDEYLSMNTDSSTPSSPSLSPHTKQTAGGTSPWQAEDREQITRSDDRTQEKGGGELIVEDISNQADDSHDASIEVVRPYQYEDPRSEPASKSDSARAPKSLDYDDLSRSDLVDSIDTLSCHQDRRAPRRRRIQKVGLKRKPSSIGHRGPRCSLVDQGIDDGNGQNAHPNKSRRRNSEGEDTETSSFYSDSAPESPRKDDHPNTMATSTETSADESTLSTSEGDPMDID